MRVYIFMGAHLPEIAVCFATLSQTDPPSSPTRILIPEDLDQAFPEPEMGLLETYLPEGSPWKTFDAFDGRAFVLIDPRLSPVPQLESLAEYLKSRTLEPEKIITCVDCARIENNSTLKNYFDACIYYSDNVLLGNRANASKSFVRNFQKDYDRRCYPCRFLLLKGNGIPSDPVEVLTPETRRISQIFDLTAIQQDTVINPLIEASCDLDLEELEEDPFRSPDEDMAPDLMIPDISRYVISHGA